MTQADYHYYSVALALSLGSLPSATQLNLHGNLVAQDQSAAAGQSVSVVFHSSALPRSPPSEKFL